MLCVRAAETFSLRTGSGYHHHLVARCVVRVERSKEMRLKREEEKINGDQNRGHVVERFAAGQGVPFAPKVNSGSRQTGTHDVRYRQPINSISLTRPRWWCCFSLSDTEPIMGVNKESEDTQEKRRYLCVCVCIVLHSGWVVVLFFPVRFMFLSAFLLLSIRALWEELA